jgi:hypothetical protein
MNKTSELVMNSLESYDRNNEKYNGLFKDAKHINFVQMTNDMEHNMVYMYDKNNKEILKSRYEVIGIYNNNAKIWTWAWSMPILRKNTIYIAKSILNYGIDLDPQFNFLKTELITSRFRISNPIQIDIHVAIASYLSKYPVVYKYMISQEEYKSLNIGKMEEIHSDLNEPSVTYYLFILDYDKYIN